MGGTLTDAVWLVAVFMLLVVLAAVALAVRRFLLERGGATVECGLRRPAGRGAWHLGVASYQRDEMRVFGAFGVLLRPRAVFPRRSITVVTRRLPLPEETAVFGSGRIVIEICTGPGQRVELAMTDQTLTGFLAWLEAAPPGSHLEDIA